MARQFFLKKKLNIKLSFKEQKLDRYCVFMLLIAAVILYGFNLAELPLRDWDEAIVARVARSISLAPADLNNWLYPQIENRPYLNKPPLIHWTIALTYLGFGVNEWSSRFVPAMLSAISVPLVYCLGREIYPQRSSAIFAAASYLTFLPVLRHGRLAMLDGAAICFFLLLLWCLLRSRQYPSFSLGVGLSLAAICLSKGIMMGLLLISIAIAFLIWDNSKILTTKSFWTGIFIGLIPVIIWYGLQYYKYGQDFIEINIKLQSFSRIWQAVDERDGGTWYYLWQLLKSAWPWLIFCPAGLNFVFKNRQQTSSKLIIVWLGIYLLAISLMSTKLPWYILPIYPALALLVGAELDRIWHNFSSITYSRYGALFLGILASLSWGAGLYLAFGIFARPDEPDLQLLFVALALTMTAAAILMASKSRYFIVVLIGGLSCSFLLFFNSKNWLWELAEAYPVKPVAAMVAAATSPAQIIYTSYPYYRPSLDFYSDRTVIPASTSQLESNWQQQENPYFLIETKRIKDLNLENSKILSQVKGWQIITKKKLNNRAYKEQ